MASALDRVEIDDRWLDFRHHFDWQIWFRCNVKILVVTDASGSFDNSAGFGLGQVLTIVADDLWPHVTFSITTAHRGPIAADHSNFRFDAHDLSQYHQIWLFGVARDQTPISSSERRVLAEFMDNGGGVFATGDHEDLGKDLCAEVPRVRSMRRWYHPGPGPNGEPVAPDQFGGGEHDTQTDDPLTPIIEHDQSDNVAQFVKPHYYSRHYPFGLFSRVARFPHPVLCGPMGTIVHLPDHMHEGLIEVPGDLTQSFTFDGYTVEEYPVSGGTRIEPEVIATATNFVTGGDFGVLGAYDGHRAGVGRVVVDATWHHWFNINLIGFINAVDPAHPTYDPTVIPVWEEIKSYFRNVAAWLAPPAMQRCLRNGSWILVVRYYDILITLRDIRERPQDPLRYYWQLGTFARDALGRVASQCQSIEWLFDLFELVDLQEVLPKPWDPRPQPDPPPFLHLDDLLAALAGGAVHSLGAELDGVSNLENVDEETLEKLLADDEAIESIARRGSRDALERIVQRHEEATDWFSRQRRESS